MTSARRWSGRTVAATVTALAAVALVIWIAWDGPVPWLDAGSYAAGIEAIADGRGITSHLAPSFSAFSGAEFVQHGGSIPFVDFPVGYPLVAAVPALVVGAKPAMLVVGTLAAAVLAAVVVLGPRRSPAQPMLLAARGVVALGLISLPISRSLFAAGLSEPLFLAVAVAAAKFTVDAMGADDEQPDRLPLAMILAGIAGLVRFVGAVLVIVPLAVMWRRDGPRRALAWGAGALAPVVANVVWASAQGSGHHLGWRSIDSADTRFVVHSIGGWVAHDSGMFDLLNPPPPWWQVLLAAGWCALTVVALVVILTGRGRLSPALAVCGSMALLLALGVAAAMLMFDSLVTLDNRLMLPSGVLTIVGVLWWATRRAVPAWRPAAVLGAAALWALAAVGPWDVAGLHASPATAGLDEAVGGTPLVLTNDADQVWWHTATPAAYLPAPIDLLTGRRIDVAAEMAGLPCLLAQQDGAIVVVRSVFTDPTAPTLLPEMVARGELSSEVIGDVILYRPTGLGCSS
jgi:hypothetical protein